MPLKKKLKRLRGWLIRKLFRTRIQGARGNTLILNDARLYGCRITFEGTGNTVEIGPGSILHRSQITLIGRNNHFTLGAHARIRAGGVFLAEDSGSRISIGTHATLFSTMIICSEGGRIEIGDDCMIAMDTCIRNSDGHAIFDTTTGARINNAADISIGSHVWLGIRSLILKGAGIGPDAIVGANSIVTGPVPAASLAVGAPARVLRQSIAWTRERTDRYQPGRAGE